MKCKNCFEEQDTLVEREGQYVCVPCIKIVESDTSKILDLLWRILDILDDRLE